MENINKENSIKSMLLYYTNMSIELVFECFKKAFIFLDVTKIKNINYIVRIAISLAFYSKVLLLLSNIPFIAPPETLISIAASYWDTVTTAYGHLTALVVGTLNFFKSIIEEYKQEVETIEGLNKQVNELNNQVEDLQQVNQEQQKKIDYLHENSVPKKIYHEQNVTQQNKIAELTGEIRTLEHTNRTLTTTNTELNQTVTTLKTTTQIERAQHYLTIIGNTAFVGIQVINAYNALFNSSGNPSSDDMKRVLSAINSLISRSNNQQTQNTASARAQQGAITGGPSRGLTNTDISAEDL